MGHIDRVTCRESLRFYANLHSEARRAESRDLRPAGDHVAHPNGCFKLDFFNRDREPSMHAVTTRFHVARLIDHRHDDTAKDGALMVSITRVRDVSERE